MGAHSSLGLVMKTRHIDIGMGIGFLLVPFGAAFWIWDGFHRGAIAFLTLGALCLALSFYARARNRER